MTTAAVRLLDHLDRLNETSRISYEVYTELRDLVDDALEETDTTPDTDQKETPVSAYDLNDPKHPGYAERVYDLADDTRSARRVAEPGPLVPATT